MNDRLYAISGFLGLPKDWDFLDLPVKGVKIEDFPLSHFNAWSKAFNGHMTSKNPILMGYSLGGRLALHALIQRPSLWAGGIIISAHPGLSSESLKEERLCRDMAWSKRFREESWNELMESWEQQYLFKNDAFSFHREEAEYQRSDLGLCLENFSLGKQEDLRQKIKELPMPLLWIVGERDQKFCAIASNLEFSHPLSSCIVIKESGHRVPWVQPDAFKKVIQQFLTRIKKLLPEDKLLY